MPLLIVPILRVRTPRHRKVSKVPEITQLMNARTGAAPTEWGSGPLLLMSVPLCFLSGMQSFPEFHARPWLPTWREITMP